MRRFGWIASAAWIVLPGCAAVPSLTFEDNEGGGSDAGDAAQESDAVVSSEAGCPTVAPAGATCCEAIPCYGSFCTAANCKACLSRCAAPDSCCSKTGNVQCQAPGMVCH